MSQEAHELIKGLMAEFWNNRRLDLARDFFHEDVIVHRGGDIINGLAAFRDNQVAPFQDAFPDLHHSLDDIVVQDDKIAIRFHGSGTLQKPFAGFPASGKRISFDATGFFRIRDGKIAEVWVLSGIALALTAAHRGD